MPPDAEIDPARAAMQRAIDEQRKTDPLIDAKLGSKEILPRLLAALNDERGVHTESLLCAAGALAGYSCQAGVRALAAMQGYAEKDVFTIVEAGEQTYFFGDHLNTPLANSQYSVWSLAAGAAQANGCTDLPDLEEIFQHVAGTVGDPSFGTPRIAEGHRPGASPLHFLEQLWPLFDPLVKEICPDPFQWPILYGMVIQEVFDLGKAVVAPDLALQIVMESAVPMSKVNLAVA